MPLISQNRENMQCQVKNSLSSTIDAAYYSSSRKQQTDTAKKFKKRCDTYFESTIDLVDLDEAKDPQ